MKILLSLAICLALLPVNVMATPTPLPEETDASEAANYDDTTNIENAVNHEENTTHESFAESTILASDDYQLDSPDGLGHFATASIEELHAYGDVPAYNNEPDVGSEDVLYSIDPPLPPPVITPPSYTSAAVVVIDADTGLVLYGNQHKTQMYPASVTKIMTALIVLEQIDDLQERIEFSNNAIFSIPRSSSHISMDVGETLTVYQALYGLMLSSANEVSIALAEHVSGTVEAFVEIMNRRAMSIGAVDTHFANPSGLPATNHVTTAYDMALIMREAVSHPLFVDIINTPRFDIPPTERQSDTRRLRNTNSLIHPGPYFNEWVIGSKTGWTHAAQHTLVTYAEHQGRRLIISTLKGYSGGIFRDTLALLSFGFSMPFEERLVFEAAAYSRIVPVYQEVNGEPLNIGNVTLRADSDIYFLLPIDFDIRDLRIDLSIPTRATPPILEGDPIGSLEVYVQNIRAGEVDLLAQNLVLALPTTNNDDDEPRAGGSEYAGMIPPPHPAYYPSYPSLSVYPTPVLPIESMLALAIPIAMSALTLLIGVIITIRKRRVKKTLYNKYSKYYQSYRYK